LRVYFAQIDKFSGDLSVFKEKMSFFPVKQNMLNGIEEIRHFHKCRGNWRYSGIALAIDKFILFKKKMVLN
jgi:hypothetical protein